ncbi:hypothetical protein FHG87_016821, partial [Trinorchestia longiramus]
ESLCGHNANCKTISHRPVCQCPPGTTGNPTDKCIALSTELKTTPRPISGDSPIVSDTPVTPAAGIAFTPAPPIAEFPSPSPPELPYDPPKMPAILPPFVIACESNDECPMDNSCINMQCYDVCILGICGTDAECKIAQHRPVCECPPGTTGDPLYRCVATLTEIPKVEKPLVEHPSLDPGLPISPVPGSAPALQPPIGIPSHHDDVE